MPSRSFRQTAPSSSSSYYYSSSSPATTLPAAVSSSINPSGRTRRVSGFCNRCTVSQCIRFNFIFLILFFLIRSIRAKYSSIHRAAITGVQRYVTLTCPEFFPVFLSDVYWIEEKKLSLHYFLFFFFFFGLKKYCTRRRVFSIASNFASFRFVAVLDTATPRSVHFFENFIFWYEDVHRQFDIFLEIRMFIVNLIFSWKYVCSRRILYFSRDVDVWGEFNIFS